MRLVRVGRDLWEVLAFCDPRGRCQVLEFLTAFNSSSRAATHGMLALLTQIVPSAGPPQGEPLSKSFGGGIYELRKQPNGKKLRVLWFYGGTRSIVCTYAFEKAEWTPQLLVERSRLLRRQFLAARSRGEVEVTDFEEGTWSPG